VKSGGCIALAREGLQVDLPDKAVQTEADSVSVPIGVPSERAEATTGLQGVSIEQVELKRLTRVSLITDPRGAGADRLRFLRMRLLEFRNQKDRRCLLVTSPLPQDGKSTTALNVASVLADAGKRTVLLIDADLHHSAVTEQLGFESRSGLSECLQAGLGPMSAVLRLEPLAFCFLPAGKPDGNPTELLQSAALPAVIAALSAQFDWIVIDSPPVAPFTDALTLKKEVDGTLLVVRAGQTPSASVEEAITLLGREHLFGIVLNAVEGLDRLYSKYSKYYRH
jgi:capsular exopolysaccharide synthesis family protein